MSLPNDPNGHDWHEPRCRQCGRFDANCKCDWPMPASAPTTPPDDENLEEPADA